MSATTAPGRVQTLCANVDYPVVMNKMMVRYGVALVACVLLIGGAHAQVRDGGVREEVDEFTGTYSCLQLVLNSASDGSGIGFQTGNDDFGLVVFVNRRFTGSDWTFSSLSPMPRDRDLVYFRFGEDDVISLKPDIVDVDTSQRSEVAGFIGARDLAAQIMSAPGDIRVRFSGRDGNRDFTILHGVAVALAQGFGQSNCWE